MVRRSSYNTRLYQSFQAINRFTTKVETLISDIDKRQSLINKDVAKIKALRRKSHLTQSNINNINKMKSAITKRGSFIKKKRIQLRKAEIQLQKHTINLKTPHYAPMSKKDKNGYFIRYRMYPLIIISEETIDDIVELVRDKLQLTSTVIT